MIEWSQSDPIKYLLSSKLQNKGQKTDILSADVAVQRRVGLMVGVNGSDFLYIAQNIIWINSQVSREGNNWAN